MMTLIFSLLFAVSANAATKSCTFAWDIPPGDISDLQGYKLYTSMISGQYDFSPGSEVADILVQDLTDPNAPGVANVECSERSFFVVTAYDTSGNESLPSNEIVIADSTAPNAPGGLRVVEIITVTRSNVTERRTVKFAEN